MYAALVVVLVLSGSVHFTIENASPGTRIIIKPARHVTITEYTGFCRNSDGYIICYDRVVVKYIINSYVGCGVHVPVLYYFTDTPYTISDTEVLSMDSCPNKVYLPYVSTIQN